jgi:ammonia channel protein AmtB
MRAAVGIRAHQEHEELGLDAAEHGVSGYPELYPGLWGLARMEDAA